MICTKILMDEHQIILRRLVHLANLLEGPLGQKASEVTSSLDFFRSYADKFHHTKEEDIYFVWMMSKDPSLRKDNSSLKCMDNEHQFGRELIRKADAALKAFLSGDSSQEIATKTHLYNFIQLLNDHIRKEDEIIFQTAEALNETAQDGDASMLPHFQKIGHQMKQTDKAAHEFEAALALEAMDFSLPPDAR